MAVDAGAIQYTVDVNTGNLLQAERRVNQSTGAIASGFSKIGSAISLVASGVGLGLLARKLVTVQRKFDRLNASVLTATGSIKDAKNAMQALQVFAEKTPFGIEQSVEAFTKLVNFGLTPSEEAMMSFGDTSSALGKDLVQMIEAVADAATGEFERLKEFGIKSKNQGDTIAFTFRGTTQIIKNSAKEIEGYLIDLGKNNFAGAMANRMETLDGSISMLDDSFDNLFKTIGEMDEGVMVDVVTAAKSAIDGLTESLQSGELLGYMDLVGDSWHTSLGFIIDDVSHAADIIIEMLGVIPTEGRSASKLLSDAFFNFPANIKAVIQLAVVEITGFVDKVAVYGKEIAKSLNPFTSYDKYDAMSATKKQFKAIDSLVKSSSNLILKTRNDEIGKVKEQENAIASLVEKYKEERAEKLKSFNEQGGLGQFKVKKDNNDNLPISDATNSLTKKVQSIGLTEEESIVEKYKKDLDLLRQAEEAKIEVVGTYEERRIELRRQAEDRIKGINKDGTDNAILNFEALESRAIGTFAAVASGAMDGRDAVRALAQSVLTEMIGNLIKLGIQSIIGQTTVTAATSTAMAAIATAAAPAAALVSLATSGANAPLAAAGITSTVGLAQAASVAGGRQFGGPVTQGNNYRINEGGRAEVLSSGGKDYLMNSPNGKVKQMDEIGGGGGTTININNMAAGVDVQASTSNDGRTIEIAVRKAVAEMTSQVASGNGAFIRALKSGTNVKTKAGS
jgi:hypothetical protein